MTLLSPCRQTTAIGRSQSSNSPASAAVGPSIRSRFSPASPVAVQALVAGEPMTIDEQQALMRVLPGWKPW